jgi:hypothetical protein
MDSKVVVKIAVVLLLILASSAAVTIAVMSVSKAVPSSGSIVAVGDIRVYSDADGKTLLTVAGWGLVKPGCSANITMYVKNDANCPMMLSLSSNNTVPADLNSYSSFSWDYNGVALAAGQLQKVTLFFSAFSGAPGGDFSFNIIITGTQF